MTADGRSLLDSALPNDESQQREVYERIGSHSRMLVVVNQRGTISSLAVTATRATGVTVGYLPGLLMRWVTIPTRVVPRPTRGTRR
ncbi:hypothetical protein D4740_05025 [Actinomyces sp. 2119]|uniref:IS110 family transposase n=1 Tax=Actinomyces sp. 2119 TaxID=2321393 RepID=UPI000E6CD6C6|nr:hypothetical protein D4740_05025 [Actinomyces sp. 2119]